jgi:superoxide dismutase
VIKNNYDNNNEEDALVTSLVVIDTFKDAWYIDFGVTRHMTGRRNKFGKF